MTAAEQAADLEQWQIQACYTQVVTDSLMSQIGDRVTALEEVLAVPWPRRLLAAWRLGREIRESLADYSGATFAERRLEALTVEWLCGVRGR